VKGVLAFARKVTVEQAELLVSEIERIGSSPFVTLPPGCLEEARLFLEFRRALEAL
jgi:hypothetical protein